MFKKIEFEVNSKETSQLVNTSNITFIEVSNSNLKHSINHFNGGNSLVIPLPYSKLEEQLLPKKD